MDAAIASANLVELLCTWPDPAQRLANLEALRGAARAYEERCRVERCAGTVAGLVEHLGTLDEQKDADLQAVPGTDNAVVVSTWHSAKGLERPVVVLASLDFSKDRDAWNRASSAPPRSIRSARSTAARSGGGPGRTESSPPASSSMTEWRAPLGGVAPRGRGP